MLADDSKPAKFLVNVFDRESESFKTKTFNIRVNNLTTVLDALIEIKEGIDPTISFRYSCRMGICGSCAMVIDGEPKLACETTVYKENSSVIRVEPMRGHPLLKDLVTDFDDFFSNHSDINPWIIRKNGQEKYDVNKEFYQTDKDIDKFLPFAECIKCGLCLDACPVVNTNKEFLGPQAIAQAYRYYSDSKDEGKELRLEYLDTLKGAWGCEFAGACSDVCPKNVDPALAIQLLKLEIANYNISKIFGGKLKKKEDKVQTNGQV